MRKQHARSLATTSTTVLLASALLASARADDEPLVSKDELVARYPSLNAESIHDGPVRGLYEVAVDMNVNYITTDGRYLIRGEIIDLDTQQNLTQTTLNARRAKLFAEIDPASEIVFSPEHGVKHRVYVLTDVDCGFCRQLHRDIAKITELGIEVRYLSYPRTGPNTESWAKAEGVWCAVDRRAALTQAKLGAPVAPVPACKANPIAQHYELGHRIGVPGTPGIYTQSGVDLGGYFPPAELFMRLEQAEPSTRVEE